MREDFYGDYFWLEDTHWWFYGRRQIVRTLLDRHLAEPPHGTPRRILDVGCGTGSNLIALASYGEVEGIDSDEEAVRLCRRRGLVHVRRLSPPPLPHEDGALDLVTALDVLEHIDDDGAMLREVFRVLRPGGLFLATVPAYRFLWGLQDEVSHHRRRYRAGALGERVAAAGLSVRRLTYFNTILFGPIAAVRITRRLRSGGSSSRYMSDFHMTTGRLANRVLSTVFSAEAGIIVRRDLPFGVSLLVLAQRPADARRGAD